MLDHAHHLAPDLGVIGVWHHLFDVGGPIRAIAGPCTQAIVPPDDDPGPALMRYLALRRRICLGFFGAVKANLSVRVVAERLVLRLSAATQGVCLGRIDSLSRPPREWLTVLRDDLLLAHQRNVPAYDVWPVLLYHDP